MPFDLFISNLLLIVHQVFVVSPQDESVVSSTSIWALLGMSSISYTSSVTLMKAVELLTFRCHTGRGTAISSGSDFHPKKIIISSNS
jgi:hypothetical protein